VGLNSKFGLSYVRDKSARTPIQKRAAMINGTTAATNMTKYLDWDELMDGLDESDSYRTRKAKEAKGKPPVPDDREIRDAQKRELRRDKQRQRDGEYGGDWGEW
jgi:hypothetical protein